MIGLKTVILTRIYKFIFIPHSGFKNDVARIACFDSSPEFEVDRLDVASG